VKLILSFFAALCLAHAVRAAEARRPNIIVIRADDLGCGAPSCYGHPKLKTPHLDRMEAEGARLTQFNCPAPFSAQTRASLMTGRYPFRCGMTQNPDVSAQHTDEVARLKKAFDEMDAQPRPHPVQPPAPQNPKATK
jgi:hypothetical protein